MWPTQFDGCAGAFVRLVHRIAGHGRALGQPLAPYEKHPHPLWETFTWRIRMAFATTTPRWIPDHLRPTAPPRLARRLACAGLLEVLLSPSFVCVAGLLRFGCITLGSLFGTLVFVDFQCCFAFTLATETVCKRASWRVLRVIWLLVDSRKGKGEGSVRT